jgi:hypothetical protein
MTTEMGSSPAGHVVGSARPPSGLPGKLERRCPIVFSCCTESTVSFRYEVLVASPLIDGGVRRRACTCNPNRSMGCHAFDAASAFSANLVLIP